MFFLYIDCFLWCNDIKERLHIFSAAASCVMAECVEDEHEQGGMGDVENEGEDERKQRERIPEAKANVALCWSKYCLNLLKLSAKAEDETAGNHEIKPSLLARMAKKQIIDSISHFYRFF